MKILILGSAGVHTERWVKHFSKKNEVVLVTTDDYEDGNVKIYKLSQGLISFIPNLLRLKKILKEEKPDVMYVQYLTTWGIMAGMTGFNNIVLSILGSDIYNYARRFPFNLLVHRYINRFKMITVECEHTRREVLKYYRHPERIVVKNWGVDSNVFKPNIDVQELKDKLFGKSDFKIIVSGRVPIPRCNVETIVRAFGEICQYRDDIKLLILGNGSSISKLRQIAKEYGIDDDGFFFPRIVFAGNVPHEDFARYISLGDVYVQTLFGDTVGNAMLDAMACGVPCISSDVMGNSEFLRHGYNGFLLSKPTDSSQLIGYILKLLDDKELRRKFIENSREIILKECNETDNMEYIEHKMSDDK